MATNDPITSPDPVQSLVRVREGKAFADSRDVASAFARQHKDVLKAYRNLECPQEFKAAQFCAVVIKDLDGVDVIDHVEMTRDGFTFLVMGFTGARAASWKVKYIEAFNRMEAELVSRPAIDPMQVLNDPAAMRGLLLTYTEKVLALEAENAEMLPKVEALDRIAEAHGTYCRTDAAKMLGQAPRTLIRWLREHGWTYRRVGMLDDLAYQSKIAAGLLDHKIETFDKADGTIGSRTQVRITAKGLTVLAQAFPPVVKVA